MAFDPKQLKAAYEKAKENNYDNTPLPEGTYYVKVDKIELGATGKDSKHPGMPMAKIQFRILEGEHKNKCLFMNQVLFGYDQNGELTAFGVKILDDFIESLEPTFECKFSDCNSADPVKEYGELLLDVAEDIEALRYDLELSYKQINGKDFAKYKVVEIYE